MPRRKYNTKDLEGQATPEHMELLPGERRLSEERLWHFVNLYLERYRPTLDNAYDSKFFELLEKFCRNTVTRGDIESCAYMAYLWCNSRNLTICLFCWFLCFIFVRVLSKNSDSLPISSLLFACILCSYIYKIRKQKKNDAPNPCPAKK